MRKLSLSMFALAVAAVIAAGPVLGATSTKKTVTAKLTGAQEVPKGSPAGSGHARVTLDSTKGQVCFTLAWSKIKPPSASHIHKGAKGKAGPVVIAFFTSAPAKHSGCVSAPKSTIAAIIKTPGAYYVNIHTSDYPAGAIRGQL